MKIGHKLEDRDKKLVDIVLGLVLYTVGVVMLALGFASVLYQLSPKIQYSGAEIIIGAVIFAIGMAAFRIRL